MLGQKEEGKSRFVGYTVLLPASFSRALCFRNLHAPLLCLAIDEDHPL